MNSFFATTEFVEAVNLLNTVEFHKSAEIVAKWNPPKHVKRWVQTREEKQAWRNSWKEFVTEWKTILREKRLKERTYNQTLRAIGNLFKVEFRAVKHFYKKIAVRKTARKPRAPKTVSGLILNNVSPKESEEIERYFQAERKNAQEVYQQILENIEKEEVKEQVKEITEEDMIELSKTYSFSYGAQEETTKEVDLEEEMAVMLFNQALKEYTLTQVCGKKKKTTFIQPEEEKEERKVYKDLADTGRIIHDRTIITVPKKIRSQTNKALKQDIPNREKFALIREMVKQATNDTKKKVALKFKIGEKWMSTRALNVSEAVDDFEDTLKDNAERYKKMGNVTDMKIVEFEDRATFSYGQRVQGGRLIMDFCNSYMIVSPQSDTNCFYHCLAYQTALIKGQKEKFTNQNWITSYARDLKQQMGNDKDFSDLSDLQTVANYYGCKFTVYDNLFHVVSEITSQETKKNRKSSVLIGQHIKVQFKHNHCHLMVPKKQNTDFCSLYAKERPVTTGINEPIKPKVKKTFTEKQAQRKTDKNEKREREVWSYDIEAYRKTRACGTQVPFAVGVCYGFDTLSYRYQYQDFYGENCAVEFFDFLSAHNPKVKKDVFLYAHNGAKYDMAVLNEVLLKRPDFQFDKDGFVELNGAVISMTIKNKHDIVFTFRDSVRLFPGSLDSLCKDLKPKYAKLSNHAFNFDDLNAENIHDPELCAEIREYLRHDCLSLAQIMIEFREQTIMDPKIEIDITNCFTSATLAKKLFFEKYYHRYCDKSRNRFIYHLNRELDTDLRRSYYGGRCDIYAYSKTPFNNVYYYDFTSLYPSVGRNMLPIGEPVKVNGLDIDLENFYGFVCCDVTTNPDTLPLHGHKYDGKLVFAHHVNTEMMLFSEEIKAGLALGYTYKPIYGYRFDKAPLLRDVMTDGYKFKAEAKRNGQPILERTFKQIINSTYGFWGLMWQDKRGVSMMTGDQLDLALEEKRVYNFNQINKGQYLVDSVRDLENIKGRSIPIASAVTSYARMELYAVMKAVQDKGEKILYSDTDSIITTCNMRKFPDLMERFMWDGRTDALSGGVELGSLKNECVDKCKKELTKEQLQEQLRADGGELKFDECQILAPKVYSLRKTLVTGKIIEIAKCKGVKSSSFEEQTQLLEGANLTKNVLTFKAGKDLLLMDQEIEGRVKVVTMEKKVSQYDSNGKLKYSKGYVKGQDVLPFVFEDGQLCGAEDIEELYERGYDFDFNGSDSEDDEPTIREKKPITQNTKPVALTYERGTLFGDEDSDMDY